MVKLEYSSTHVSEMKESHIITMVIFSKILLRLFQVEKSCVFCEVEMGLKRRCVFLMAAAGLVKQGTKASVAKVDLVQPQHSYFSTRKVNF